MTRDKVRVDEAFETIFDSFLAGKINTIMPGQIESFDRATGMATIAPSLKRKYIGVDETVALAPIENVPVFMLGSGDRWMTTDLAEGSSVILLFCQRSIATWLEQGGIVDPVQSRKFALSDAIALAGIMPLSEVLSPEIEEGSISMRSADDTSHVRIDAAGDVHARADSGAGNVVLNDGTGTAVEFARLQTAFNQLKADFDALVTKYNTHVHPGVTAGGASTAVTLNIGVPSIADMTPAESATVVIP